MRDDSTQKDSDLPVQDFESMAHHRTTLGTHSFEGFVDYGEIPTMDEPLVYENYIRTNCDDGSRLITEGKPDRPGQEVTRYQFNVHAAFSEDEAKCVGSMFVHTSDRSVVEDMHDKAVTLWETGTTSSFLLITLRELAQDEGLACGIVQNLGEFTKTSMIPDEFDA